MNSIGMKAVAAIPITILRAARRIGRRLAKPARLYWLEVQTQHAEDHITDLQAMHEAIPKDIVRMHRLTVQLAAKRMAIERGLA
ncbi:hypothetical protein [Massilia sp. METH4]|uniref:hypothetical protein n=1 Tax=Massilia sp. METH4 TaxID=3123041 RepID=UPI0030D5ADD5